MRNLLIPTGTSALALFAFTFATAAPVSAGADVPPAEAVESIVEDVANARIANKLARAMPTCSTVPPTAQIIISLDYYVSFVLRRCSTSCFEIGGEECPCTIDYYL